MTIKRVGVVGAGVIGTGVAQALAETGHEVVLVDVDPGQLERARREMRRLARLKRLVGGSGRAAPPATTEPVLGTDHGALAEVDFVVENVTESFPVKREVFERLDRVCRPETVFASNTSALSITRLAAVTRRPSKVLGIHFMNPVPLKPMVEVVRGFHTSAETLATAAGLLAAMGKEWVVVEDLPGFVSNRVLMPMINEAIYLVHEGVAPAADVDRIFRGCFGHKMGPLETADLIGLDTILKTIEVLYESYCDSKYRPCPLLRKMVDAGLTGRKSGRGFYGYEDPAAATGPGTAGEAER